MSKTFVKVVVEHNPNGTAKPLSINWHDGRMFEIDQVIDVRKAPSLKGGGIGMRYTCRVYRKTFYLFDVDGRWFIEG